MPQPGSRAYDVQKHKLGKEMVDQGVDDETAEDVSDDAMRRQAERGDATPRPNLPPKASPGANPPGHKNRKPDDEGPPIDPEEVEEVARTGRADQDG